MTLDQLQAVVPEIKWRAYLQSLQDREVLGTEEVVIYAVEYMSKLVTLLDETDPRTVSNYMMWRFVRHRINNVDDRFDDIKQSFYHALFGREESPQRWKVCIAQVNTNMGMAVGSMFGKPDAAIECVFVCRSVACWLSGSCVDGLVLNRRSSEHKSQLKLESIRALANCITFAVGAAGHFHFHFHLPTSPFPCERPHVVIHMLQIALRHSAAYEIDEWTTSRLISVIVAN